MTVQGFQTAETDHDLQGRIEAIRTALAELTTRHTGVTPTLPELPIP